MLCCVLCYWICWLINKSVYLFRFDYVAILAHTMSTNAVTWLHALDVCFCFFLFCIYRHQEFQFLCWMLRIVGHKVSTKSLMAAFSDCFQSSSCLLLSEYWNLVPNNISVRVKTKIWLPFKTWRSLSAPRWAAYHTGNWNSWCLDWGHQHSLTKTKPFTTISLSLSL